MLTAIIIASQLTGCSLFAESEMLTLINEGREIEIEVAMPSYEIVETGVKLFQPEWEQLDQATAYPELRSEFDTILNINKVSHNGINGKSGSLYVDRDGDIYGNTAMEDAFRNKVFVEKYWRDSKIKDSLIGIADKAYVDIGDNREHALMATLNAYLHLFQGYEQPEAFNPTVSVNREEFYAMVFKSEEGVQDLGVSVDFEDAIGGRDALRGLTGFAEKVHRDGFLQTSNKSLTDLNFRGSITRAEAIYLMINRHLNDQLEKVTGKEDAFKDTKNGGDIALKQKFKYEDKDTGDIVGKEMWQAYTIAYMIQNPRKGMQEELYKAMVVAKNLGLVEGDYARWDEPISRAETIDLLLRTYLAKNELYGYLSTVEYGKMNETKFRVYLENGLVVLGADEETGDRFGEGWFEDSILVEKPDIKRVLDSGFTLEKAVAGYYSFAERIIKEEGKTIYDELSPDNEKLLGGLARNMGTSLKEIRSIAPEDMELIMHRYDTVKRTGGVYREEEDKPVETVQKPVEQTQKPVEQTQKPSTPTSKTIEFKTDQWHTKEEREAAAQRAREGGDYDEWIERVIAWEGYQDWQKNSLVSPYYYGLGTDGTVYHDNLDQIPEHRRHLYKQTKGGKWYFHGGGLQ